MAEHPSICTETTILILATRPAARLAAAGILLSSALAQAHPPTPGQPPARCTSAQPCPSSGAAAGDHDAAPRVDKRQAPECGRLRAAIVESEQAERRVRAAMIESVQQDLAILRDRYRRLGCRTPART